MNKSDCRLQFVAAYDKLNDIRPSIGEIPSSERAA